MSKRSIVSSVVLLMLLVGTLSGCQTLRQVAGLRNVDFALSSVNQLELAGVPLQRVQSYEDLRATDVARLAAAIAQNRLPVAFDLNVAAENPQDNPTDARMLELDWTLFIQDRETISGVLDREFVLPRGEVTTIPLQIRLDLVEFFGQDLQNLVELALSLSGQGGAPTNVRLEAMPTIQTPVGPLRYPQPITIVARDVG